MSIILELQKLAVDSNCDVLSLLRKAYLVSRKLDITEFQEWITSELNGYNNHDEIPVYRHIIGSLKGFNPYRGWIPVIISDKDWEETLCTHKVFDSIPSLFSLMENQENNTFSIQLPGAVIQTLCSMTGHQANYELHISSNSIANIIEQVKNKILDWSLLLEESGIIGSELCFTEDEKNIVHKNPQIVNYVSNFYGNIENSKIQQGTTQSTIE